MTVPFMMIRAVMFTDSYRKKSFVGPGSFLRPLTAGRARPQGLDIKQRHPANRKGQFMRIKRTKTHPEVAWIGRAADVPQLHRWRIPMTE